MIYRAGIDIFELTAGTVEESKCQACHSVMNIERDVVKKMGKYGQPLPQERKVDIFTCPYTGQDWHTQVIHLQREMNDTPSKRIEEILAEEIQQILIHRQPTKKLTGWKAL